VGVAREMRRNAEGLRLKAEVAQSDESDVQDEPGQVAQCLIEDR
jgi:hypothetical protein